MKDCFYTYIYLDPRKPGVYIYGEYTFDYEPFYVGKGKGTQDYSHLRYVKYRKNTKQKILETPKEENTQKLFVILNILNEGLEPIITRFQENMCASFAFDLERELVFTIGRRDLGTGPLTNLCDGGIGPTNLGPEGIQKLREAGKRLFENEEWRNHIATVTKAGINRPEVLAKKGENQRRLWQNPEYRAVVTKKQMETKSSEEYRKKHPKKEVPPKKGVHGPQFHSEETKKKLSESLKKWYKDNPERSKKVFSPEGLRRLSEAAKGRVQTLESRRKRSEVQKGRVFTEEHKQNLRGPRGPQKKTLERQKNSVKNSEVTVSNPG